MNAYDFDPAADGVTEVIRKRVTCVSQYMYLLTSRYATTGQYTNKINHTYLQLPLKFRLSKSNVVRYMYDRLY